MARVRRPVVEAVRSIGPPPALLDIDDPLWRDDLADLADYLGASRDRQEAAVWLARRARFARAVQDWAREAEWMHSRYRHRPDLVRLLRAGVPYPGHELEDAGDTTAATDEDQMPLYLLAFGH